MCIRFVFSVRCLLYKRVTRSFKRIFGLIKHTSAISSLVLIVVIISEIFFSFHWSDRINALKPQSKEIEKSTKKKKKIQWWHDKWSECLKMVFYHLFYGTFFYTDIDLNYCQRPEMCCPVYAVRKCTENHSEWSSFKPVDKSQLFTLYCCIHIINS